jgi:hypothetical protein
MRTSVAAFERRSGERYSPSDALRHLAQPLTARDACPTLFRYPGPEGLASFLRGGLSRLGASDARWLWLADRPAGTSARAAGRFGVVAVLDPLRLSPCPLAQRRGHYLAENRALRSEDALVWAPPTAAGINWDRVLTPEQAIRRMGSAASYVETREATLESLSAYLEELSALSRAQAPSRFGAWCAVSRTERRRLLAEYGVEGRWTR